MKLEHHSEPITCRQVSPPEVPVHAAVNRPPAVMRTDALIVTPGAPHAVGQLEHHWGGEAGRAGQDVPGCAEPGRSGTDHRHPQHPVCAVGATPPELNPEEQSGYHSS